MDVNILIMKISKLVSSCCPALWSGRLNPAEAESLAAVFRILGEPVRLQILSLIAAQLEGEVCACGLTEPLGLSQPTVSHHLKVMYEAGLLQKERRGTWIYYRLVPEQFEVLRNVLAMPESRPVTVHPS
jgi:ArsR family transcriptional regulator